MNNLVMDRFHAKIIYENDCWLWQGSKYNGYGKLTVNRKVLWAHRFSYEQHKGDIPTGMQIDHLCGNRSCVNPEHLEVVTQKENLLRSPTASTINAQKTHCPRGHRYDSVRKDRGTRYCSICQAA